MVLPSVDRYPCGSNRITGFSEGGDVSELSSARTEMSFVPSSPNKRLKTQDQEYSDHNHHLSPPFQDDQPDSCGICYADHGTSVRGEIDCCNHFFCFVCIMEWSKHESRCPLCRQRFSTVRRPRKPGLFPFSRLVKVPVRDQVYHVHGNITTGPADPYAETRCSVCNGGENESYLLLCDLCDIASHTYCVGLGYVVPEGDWFCQDCTVSRSINDNNNVDHQCDVPTSEPSVTILDIVREPNSQMVQRSRLPPLVNPLPDRVNRTKQRNRDIRVTPLPEWVTRNKDRNCDMSARTLRQCRNVQLNIRAFRQNWNALRNGSLRFPSTSSKSVVRHDKQHNTDSFPRGKSDKLHSSASTSFQQSIILRGPSNNKPDEKGSEDVNKAWKMLERARMEKTNNHKSSVLPQGLDHPTSVLGPKQAPGNHCNDQGIRINQSGSSTGNEKRYSFPSFSKVMDSRWPLDLGGKKHSGIRHKGTTTNIRDQASHLEKCCEPSLPRKTPGTILCVPRHENGERNFGEEQSRGSAPSDGKIESVSSSSRDAGEKKRSSKNFGHANTQDNEDPKNEIKSLVKLNLKILSKDKRLGVNAFKEIARHSTYAILAACHEKLGASSSSSLCSHGGDHEHLRKSTLMPNCCRQCFYMFVKNVVSSTMMEKVGEGGSSSS